jgi:DNA-directed RNA polymerase sigma subunit (sigma70/sigma32)
LSSRFPDDTELDAIAAQVRSVPVLGPEKVTALLSEARRSPAGTAAGRLVEQHLGVLLDAVLARRGRGAELLDLYQDGSVAATVAVREYAARGGTAAGLPAYVAKVVDRFLDEVLERIEAQRLADALLIEQVKVLETAEVALRRRFEREPTNVELAAALEWTPALVEVVSAALRQAREVHDAEIVDFLDDADPGDTTDI